ncbi:hypothetical protein [Cetobacterium sp.]|uniref:hypothetical protein n=1 Tax=Cetobacterium sp. TaxID=2071632 RepID=UPI003F3D0229
MDKQNCMDNRILKECEEEAKRSLINRWKKGFQSQILELKEIDEATPEKLKLVIENLCKELKGESEDKIVFFDEKKLSFTKLKNIEKLNKILLRKGLRKEEIEHLKERKIKLKRAKQGSRALLRKGIYQSGKGTVVIENLYGLLECFENTLLDVADKKSKVNSCEKMVELTEKRELFIDMFVQIIIYHFSHEKIQNEERISILSEILKEVNKEVEIIKEKLKIKNILIKNEKKYNHRDIYLVFFKHYFKYEIEYRAKLMSKIQNFVKEDQFKFEPISESEIKEYFDSLLLESDDGTPLTNWTKSKMISTLSEKEGIRDNKFIQKQDMKKAIVDYLNFITGRKLSVDNLKNLKVIHQEIFINNTKLQGSGSTPRQQILKLYEKVENLKKEKNIFELTPYDFILKYREEFEGFFSEEEKLYISEKITRGMYISEGMETEYKLTKEIEEELTEYTKELFKFKDEGVALESLNEFIERIFDFLKILMEKYNLNNYKVMGIEEKLKKNKYIL